MTERKPAAVDVLPDHLPRWLEAVSRRLHSELGIRGRGDFPELRGSHRRVLQMIPSDGIRITDLATVAGMTKQAMGEFVDWLEGSGFVSSRRDESDGRVRLVARTALGDKAAEAAHQAIASVEKLWREEIGPASYDAMKEALRRLGQDSFKT
jgi:DNA-binding MarR family transcriptional regulator